MIARRSFIRGLLVAAALPVVVCKAAMKSKTRWLYEVGRTKEFATIDAALDAIWSEHGTRPFTEDLKVAVSPGVYQGSITVDGRLCPTDKHCLHIEGQTGACVPFDETPYRVELESQDPTEAIIISRFVFIKTER